MYNYEKRQFKQGYYPLQLQIWRANGAANVGTQPPTITSGRNGAIRAANQPKIYDKRVALDGGGYDKGGILGHWRRIAGAVYS